MVMCSSRQIPIYRPSPKKTPLPGPFQDAEAFLLRQKRVGFFKFGDRQGGDVSKDVDCSEDHPRWDVSG